MNTPAAVPVIPAGGQIVSHEEKVEYRDDIGNLLDPEQVKELEGKVSFSTRYETRTRILDAQGNELYNGPIQVEISDRESAAGTVASAPEPETVGEPAGQANKAPPKNVAAGKESVEKESKATAEPEADLSKETGKDEL